MRTGRSVIVGGVLVAAALAACGSSPAGSSSAAARAATPGAYAGAPADDGAGARDDGDADGGALRRARVAQGYAVSPVPLATEGMSERRRMLVGLGSYLVNAAGVCAGCHTATPDRFLAGGVPFFLDGAGHVVWSRNLTPDAATGLPLTLEQFKEAIRTGRDFHPGQSRMLAVMPWRYLRWESDLDLEAIYAYLRAIPPVANQVPRDDKDALPLPASVPFPGVYTDGDVARPLLGTHRSFDPRRGLAIVPRALPPALGDDAARAFGLGSYLANATVACSECHTHPDRTPDGSHLDTAAYLTGGTVYRTPPPLQPVTGYVRAMSANLEGAGAGFFSEPGSSLARFEALLRTGTLVDETPARPLAFPMFIVAHSLGHLVPADVEALYAYLSATQRVAGEADVVRQPPARWCAVASDCREGEACDGGECTGAACAGDAGCGACQTCEAGACVAPLATSACLLGAQ